VKEKFVKRLHDSRDSTMRKEKFVKRLPDSQNPIVKKEKVRVKGLLIARIPS
jgi:hypothetical protein